jgi:hypothetical protein
LKSIFAVCGSVPLTLIVAVTPVVPLTVLPLPGVTQTFSVYAPPVGPLAWHVGGGGFVTVNDEVADGPPW